MSIYDSIRSQMVPITPEGYPFIGAFALASLFLFWLWTPLGWLGTLATLWCVYFFRDPPRTTPVREGLVVSPADGKVSQITTLPPPHELGLGPAPLLRISIFMSVFDCHINRSPVAGRVEKIVYQPGKFFSADLDKASSTTSAIHWSLPPRARALPWCRSPVWWRGASSASCARASRSAPASALA